MQLDNSWIIDILSRKFISSFIQCSALLYLYLKFISVHECSSRISQLSCLINYSFVLFIILIFGALNILSSSSVCSISICYVKLLINVTTVLPLHYLHSSFFHLTIQYLHPIIVTLSYHHIQGACQRFCEIKRFHDETRQPVPAV